MNQLNRFIKVSFICDKCQRKFERGIVYSLAPNLDELKNYPTYCVNCGEIEDEPETCSFREVDNKTNHYLFCDQPLFDKKKQLCRSHNKQVWKRFNDFTRDMSVSSTAGWLEAWEQSKDWKYWWNLSKEKDLSTDDELLNDKKELKSTPPEPKKKKNWGPAPIHETTENIQSLNLDKRTLKKTGRVHLFATRVKKEWIEQLKSIAYEERLHYNEVLEKVLECYVKHRKNS